MTEPEVKIVGPVPVHLLARLRQRRRLRLPHVPSRLLLSIVETSGLACIVAGVALWSVPAALIVGGILAVGWVYAIENG